MGKGVVCPLISYFDSESFSEVFYVSCERGIVLRAFLIGYYILFSLYAFHHIHCT